MASKENATFDFDLVKSELLEELSSNKFLPNIKKHLDDLNFVEEHSYETEQSRNLAPSPAHYRHAVFFRWIDWAKRENNLKVISVQVPFNILPNGYEGELSDVKVFVKHGPDDPVYDNNKAIRDRVARGNAFLEITGKSQRMLCALQAMKKFTGGLGDDDDRVSGDAFVWQRYFTKPLSETDYVISTNKANGEAAHLSCLYLDGEFVLCGGSKNVHLMFKRKADIDRYTESRYRIATEICHTVIDFLDKMTPEKKHRLLSFMAGSRYTAVFEILSPLHQHVVNLSYLKSPALKFITWSKCELEPSEKLEHLNIVPPHVGIEIAKSLGLDPVDYEVVGMKNLDQRMKQIRQGVNSEGEVLYFIDKNGAVIGLLKKKTVWYIMCRAIREKVKTACNNSTQRPSTFSKSKSLKQVEKRIKEIQKWLNLEDSTIKDWQRIGMDCVEWVLKELDQGKLSMNEVQDQFPVYWAKFLKDTGATDEIEVKITTLTEGACGDS